MKKIYKWELLFFVLALLSLTIKSKAQEPVALPLVQDFELYNGANLAEVYPGWNEAEGLPSGIVNRQSSWFASGELYGSNDAAVNISGKNHHQWIVSPVFTVSESTVLSFKTSISLLHKEPMLSYLSGDDKFMAMISEEGKDEFESLIEFSGNSKQKLELELKEFEIELASYAGKNVQIGFYATDGVIEGGMASVHLDDIVIEDKKAKDPMMVSFINPSNKEIAGSRNELVVCIKNNGTEIISHIPVRGNVRGSINANYFGVYSKELAPGECGQIALGSFDMTKAGSYVFTAFIDSEEDQVAYNNMIETKLVTEGLVSTPVPVFDFQNVISDLDWRGWNEARGDMDFWIYPFDSDWKLGVHKDERCGEVYFTENYTHDWLISPSFKVTGNSMVSFDMAIRYGDEITSMGSDDYIAVMVSEDNMNTWNEIGRIDKESNISLQWKNYSYALKEYKGKDIVMAIFASTGEVIDPEYYNVFIDNIEIRDFFAQDLAIKKIKAPGIMPVFGDEHFVKVELENLGVNPATDFKLSYAIDGKVLSMETYKGTINPGELATFSFAVPVNLIGAEDKTFEVAIVYDEDENAENDKLSEVLRTYSIDLDKGIYKNGFEAGEDISAWTILNSNNDECFWKPVREQRLVYEGQQAFGYSSFNSTKASDDWLVTPAIKMHPGTYRVSFDYANRAGALPEKLRVMFGNKPEKLAFVTELVDMGEITNNAFYNAKLKMNILEEGYYYIAWHNYGDVNQMGMSIDNVKIEPVNQTDLKLAGLSIPRAKLDESNKLAPINELLVTIENSGKTEVSEFKLGLRVNGGEKLEKSFTKSIIEGKSIKQVFNTGLDLDPYQVYDIEVWVVNSEDSYVFNDTLVKKQVSLASYHTGFEPEDLTAGWVAESIEDPEKTFEIEKENYRAHTGDYFYKLKTDNYTQTANDDWLLSEGFFLEEGKCYELSFWYNPYLSEDSLVVAMGQKQSADAMVNVLHDYGRVEARDDDGYYYSTLMVSVEESGDYYFGWHVFGDMEAMSRYCFYLDDVSLTEVNGFEPVVDFAFHVLDKQVAFEGQCEKSTSVIWDFGDKNTSEEDRPFHTYEKDGSYKVILTAKNGCASKQVEKDVLIECPVNTGFSVAVSERQAEFTSTIDDTELIVWDFGDGNYSFEKNPKHEYGNNGEYLVKVKVTGKCGTETQSETVSIESSTGIEQVENKGCYVYPNPVESVMYVDGIDLEQIKSISLFNVIGQMIRTFYFNGNFEGQVNLEDVRTGAYFIQLTLDDDSTIVKKIYVK